MTHGDRLQALDGLRGIAILLVVWFHVWQITWLPAPLPALQFLPETGFSGVTFFFFLSGFVISYPFLLARARGTAPPTWRHFAWRRAIKIVPSYVLSIAVLIAIGYARFLTSSEAFVSIGTHLLFIHTWFAATFGSINGVLWTLAVEVQFYVIFPLIWFCFSRKPALTAGVMIALALGYRIYATHCCLTRFAPQLLDNLPGYLDIFALGMLGALTFVSLEPRAATRSWRTGGLVATGAGIVLFCLLSQNLYDNRHVDMWDTVWQTVNRTWWGVAFLLVTGGTLFAAPWWQRFVGNPLLVFCGFISYNWYLYHQAIARELLAHGIPPFATSKPMGDPHWQVAFTIVAFGATLLVATVITMFFERPLMRLGRGRKMQPE